MFMGLSWAAKLSKPACPIYSESMMKKTTGTFFELGGRNTMEVLTASGVDYIVIDREHGCFSAEETVDYIRIAELGNVLSYVRIPSGSRTEVLHMLDIGARGLIVPNITTVQQVQELVEYGKFAPVGKRGYCPNRTTVYGAKDWGKDPLAYMDEANRRVKLYPQCETAEALEQIGEIAAIDGIDGIFIGPLDLSIALGLPLQTDHPDVQAAIARILAACHKAGKEALIFAGNAAARDRYFAQGFDSVALGLDAMILLEAYRKLLQ